MSRLIFMYAAMFAVFTTSCRKDKLEWKQVERIETGTPNRLNRILFIDNNKGFVAGGDRFLEANILATQNGGSSWALNSYPEAGKGLYGIAQSSSGRILAIGFDGKILFSDDKGANWQFVQLSPWLSYKDVFLKADNTGIVIGGNSFNSGFIVHINSAGHSTGYDSMSVELNKLVMTDEHSGYISGYGVVLKTTDGGHNWAILDVKNDNFTGIHILNKTEIWVCGIAGSIYHSTNGGQNWDKLRNGNSLANKRYALKDIYFSDSQKGWAVGEEGLVIYTEDGGNNWKEYESFTTDALHDICPTPDGHLMVAGDNGCLYKLSMK